MADIRLHPFLQPAPFIPCPSCLFPVTRATTAVCWWMCVWGLLLTYVKVKRMYICIMIENLHFKILRDYCYCTVVLVGIGSKFVTWFEAPRHHIKLPKVNFIQASKFDMNELNPSGSSFESHTNVWNCICWVHTKQSHHQISSDASTNVYIYIIYINDNIFVFFGFPRGFLVFGGPSSR